MLFKNKSTGLVWDITDGTHIKRCTNDPNFEEVKPKKKEQPKKEEPKTEVKKDAPKKATPKKQATTTKKKSTAKK